MSNRDKLSIAFFAFGLSLSAVGVATGSHALTFAGSETGLLHTGAWPVKSTKTGIVVAAIVSGVSFRLMGLTIVRTRGDQPQTL